MPNTPCLVSESAAGFTMGQHTTEEDKEIVQSVLGAVGYAVEVKESQIDGALAGSLLVTCDVMLCYVVLCCAVLCIAVSERVGLRVSRQANFYSVCVDGVFDACFC